MKRISILAILVFFTNILVAQNFVSTTPENKNVVLEEFTGIHCGYCPDGHRLGQLFHDQNPGNVVLINIHSGSFAVPSAGEPDFRTPFGSAIDGQASVSGYPAGTINRHLFPGMGQSGGTAMSRGDWASAGTQILAQPSCVNVAAEASLNISTRELTVDVEAYYTDNSTNATNKINVVLLQNNVEGPQSGASGNPTAILPNGNYNHQHMLRHLLTGQWGDDIVATTTGSLYQNTFSYIIPSDLNGVAYDLFNLEVAVFVSEGQQEIISGNMGNMTHIVPPGVNLIDLGATTNMAMPTSLCDNNVTPEITVTNNSTMAVDTFEVSYTLNTGFPTKIPVYTPLAVGASTTIQFPTITVPSGENNISYSAATMAGTSFIDNAPNNNLASSGSFNTISPTAFATSHFEGFEGYANMTPAPNNGLLLNPSGYRVFIIDATWPGPGSGGYGNSHNSFRWQFTQMSGGQFADLVFAKLDFSNSTGNGMTYSYAHALASGWENDRLQVLVSTDCGATWNLESQLIGTSLATTNPVPIATNFYPTSNDWATDTIDLSAYDGNADVMISFKGVCAGGNNLYIDDIDIGSGIIAAPSWDCDGQGNCSDPGTGQGQYSTLNACQQACVASGITETISEGDFLLFPNPITNKGTLQLNIEETISLEIGIFDVLGKEIQHIDDAKFTEGIHNITFDTSKLEDGTYFLKYESVDKVKNVKFVISH
tara:strand:+ start:1372 stop:3501 length:2130 start_codon:yes stop_codon:yes gene_type:complete